MLTPTKTGLSTLALAASCGVRCLEVRTSCGVRSSRARRRVSARRAGGDGAWATVLDLDVPGAGRIVGVAMPQGVGVERARAPPAGSPVLAELAPAEVAFPLDNAFSEPAARDFWGGRLALRRAAAAAGVAAGPEPLLRLATGAPRAPPGAVASVSHKRPLAVALARAAEAAPRARGVGVDVERAREPRAGAARLARRVVRADERRAYASLRGVVDVRVRAALFFSLKEAVYKAVAGDAAAGLALRHIRLGPFVDDACGVRVDNCVLPAGAAVDARWRVARIPAGDDRAYFLSTATYRRAPGA